MKILANKKFAWLGALVFAFTFMLSALIMPAAANAEVHADHDFANATAYGNCGANGDNVQWILDGEGTLTIFKKDGASSGAMADFEKQQAPWYSSRNSIAKVVIELGVTSVGGWAFVNCNSLTKAELPSSITRIGYGAFSDCWYLIELDMPSAETIEDGAFCNCASLKRINSETDGYFVIPEGVTHMGSSVFEKCCEMCRIDFPETLQSIGRMTQATGFDWSDGANNVFCQNYDLKSIVMKSSNVVTVAPEVFKDSACDDKFTWTLYVPTQSLVTAYKSNENVYDADIQYCGWFGGKGSVMDYQLSSHIVDVKTIDVLDGYMDETKTVLAVAKTAPGPGGDPATGVVEDTIAIALFAAVVMGVAAVVVLNKKKNNI